MIIQISRNKYITFAKPFKKEIPNKNYQRIAPGIFMLDCNWGSDIPWWRCDFTGWPIETFKGRPIASFVRIVLQNIRKIIVPKIIWN